MKTALIIAPHPDDAELGMGGTIARMIAGGWNVIVVDLTDGEPTPFGSKEIRAQEAKIASGILGITNRLCLGMPNRYLEPTLENRRKLAELIRLNCPDVICGPAMPDWHPDHKAASEIIAGARFEAKYSKTDVPGQPHWCQTAWQYYSPHRLEYPRPSAIIDVSDFWEQKIAAIEAYQSQLKNSLANSTYGLLERIQIVGKYFGQGINVRYGEPVFAQEPMSLNI